MYLTQYFYKEYKDPQNNTLDIEKKQKDEVTVQASHLFPQKPKYVPVPCGNL